MSVSSSGSRIFKRKFLVYKKLNSELAEDQKMIATNISKHSKLNLASSNLTHSPSMTWKTRRSNTIRGHGTTLRNFNFNASSTKILEGFLKSLRRVQFL